MKIDTATLMQGFLGAGLVGVGWVGWNLNQTVTKIDVTMDRIAPIVEEAVAVRSAMVVQVEALRKDHDDLDERVRDLETGG